MEEAQLLNKDVSSFDVTFLQKNNITSFLAFLQNTQSESSALHLSIVHYQNNIPLLFVCGYTQAFLLEMTHAQAPEFERFFANIQFFVETERELATLLYHLPLERQNINDIKIARALCNQTFAADTPYFKINSQEFTAEINIAYIKNLVLRNIENYNLWKQIVGDLTQNNRLSIYESIVSERYHKLSLYNTCENNLARISSLYTTLSPGGQKIIEEVHGILQQCAEQMKVPLSSVATLQALEALALKTPKTFDEITHISGFNKKIVHSAVIRKILGITAKIMPSIKRDRPLEMVLDAILSSCGTQYNIDKNLIASKHDIISFINGNLNVDFLKGWKKSVFGEKALEFLNNRSVIEAINMQFVVSSK
jgi:hypothetical protein